MGNTSTSGMPVLYLGDDGRLRGQFWNGTRGPIASNRVLNDNVWHHVVLTATSTTQSLYVDGQLMGSITGGVIYNDPFAINQIGAAYAATPSSWPYWGTTHGRYYAGYLDEVAIYSHPLSAETIKMHYDLGRQPADQLSKLTLPSGKVAAEIDYDTAQDRVSTYTDHNGGTWKLDRPVVAGGATDLRRTVEVRDPADRTHLYEYDALGGWLLRTGRPNGAGVRPEDQPPPDEEENPAPPSTEGMVLRSYTRDDKGRMTKVTDESGREVRMTYDTRGNVTSTTKCRVGTTGECHTERTTYSSGFADPFDPRWDKPVEQRDGRSASATDNTYKTALGYTATGDLQTLTTPDGAVLRHAYTTGAEPAPGGGTMPSGLLRTTTDPRGADTTYSYLTTGQLSEVTMPSGLATKYTYDAVGRRLTETEVSDSHPAGVTTTYTYDAASRVATMTGPDTVDSVSGERHQQRVEFGHDVDGNVETMTTKDLLSDAEPRVVTTAYDEHNRQSRVTDADGNETNFSYDQFGNKTSLTDAGGNRYDYAYTSRNMLAEVRLQDADSTGTDGYAVLQSTTYDQAGEVVRQGDALGRDLHYVYNDDGTLQSIKNLNFHNPDGSTRTYVVEANTYDGAGNVTTSVTDNGKTTVEYVHDAVGRLKSSVVNPGGVSRTSTYTYDLAGNVERVVQSGTPSNVDAEVPNHNQTVDYTYDTVGRRTGQSVAMLTGAPQVTSWTYDQRGLPLSVTQPRGNAAEAVKADLTGSSPRGVDGLVGDTTVSLTCETGLGPQDS